MAFQNTSPPSATPLFPERGGDFADRALERRVRDRRSGHRTLLDHPVAVFLLASGTLLALTHWLQAHGYVDQNSLVIWAKLLALRDTPSARLEYLGFGFAHGPIYLTMLAGLFPGVATPLLPYQLSALCGAGVLAALYMQFRRQRSAALSWFGLSLFALNPVFLWAATSSLQNSLAMAVFYALCMSLLWLPASLSPQAFLRFAALLTLMFIVDERVLYLVPGLILLMPAVLPRALLARATFASYLLLFTPFFFAVLAWAYLNWLFLHSAWDFLTSATSAFLDARLDYLYTPWLVDYGGKILEPALIAVCMLFVTFPYLLVLFVRASGRAWVIRAGLVVFGSIAVAVVLATFHGTLAHPVRFICLAAVAVGIGAGHLRARSKLSLALALACMAAGIPGGWATLNWEPTTQMVRWTQAFSGTSEPVRLSAEKDLAVWLRHNPAPTLMDDSDAYAVIAELGSAENLILPFSVDYKLALRRNCLRVPQIAVLEPGRSREVSLISTRFPELYSHGANGYARVYDRDGWRVYRHAGKVARDGMADQLDVAVLHCRPTGDQPAASRVQPQAG